MPKATNIPARRSSRLVQQNPKAKVNNVVKAKKRELQKEHKKSKPNETNINGIFKLNFECLVHIVSFLQIKDLANLDRVSDNFKAITEYSYKRYKVFDCRSIAPVTFIAARTALVQIGAYITSIIIANRDLFFSGKSFFELVSKYCVNLENISISDICLDMGLSKEICILLPKLKSIELIHCNNIDNCIGNQLKTAKSLAKMNLQRNDIRGLCISEINNLISLNLSNCRFVQPDYFTKCCLNNKSLVELNIIRCSYLTSKSIIDITTNLLNLEELAITTTTSYYHQKFASNYLFELEDLPKLKKLHIQSIEGHKNFDDLLIKLAKKDLLQLLDISKLQISPKTIEALTSFNKLEILCLSFASRDDKLDELLLQLGIKGNIKELHISGCCTVTTADLISFVENSPNICVLDIVDCDNVTDELYYSISASLKQQNRQQRLTVYVRGTQINETEIFAETNAQNSPLVQLDFSKSFKMLTADDSDLSEDESDDSIEMDEINESDNSNERDDRSDNSDTDDEDRHRDECVIS